MRNYFVDIEFQDLKKLFAFVDEKEFVFDLMDSSFNYEVLVVTDKKHVFIVRCWVNGPEDLKNLSEK